MYTLNKREYEQLGVVLQSCSTGLGFGHQVVDRFWVEGGSSAALGILVLRFGSTTVHPGPFPSIDSIQNCERQRKPFQTRRGQTPITESLS